MTNLEYSEWILKMIVSDLRQHNGCFFDCNGSSEINTQEARNSAGAGEYDYQEKKEKCREKHPDKDDRLGENWTGA